MGVSSCYIREEKPRIELEVEEASSEFGASGDTLVTR